MLQRSRLLLSSVRRAIMNKSSDVSHLAALTNISKRLKVNIPAVIPQSISKDFSSLQPLTSTHEDLDAAARRLFKDLDDNSDGLLSREEFVTGLMSLKEIDITEVECNRLFGVIDCGDKGVVSPEQFLKEMRQYRWLRSVVVLYHKSKNCVFETKKDYDFSKSTNENYAFHAPSASETDSGHHEKFFGEFSDIRASRDYRWHGNYIRERQLWQDRVVKSCLGKTEPQARPWIIYSCGPMGVGKGHVLSWLSTQGLFPLEFIAHIDPDFFKRVMPEWDTYRSQGEENAGSLCHLESAYMQEIAQEVAMRHRQHVWVDGSLSDGAWFSKVFQDIRKRYPHYRIAIIHITASEGTIRERIQQRAALTGRSIPESQIARSLECPEQSIKELATKCDLVIRIVNESTISLKCVEDYSGNWRGALERHFGSMSYQPPEFPSSLGPLYLEKTSLLGRPFHCSRTGTSEKGEGTSLSLQSFPLCLSEACIASPHLRTFLDFAARFPDPSAEQQGAEVVMTPELPMGFQSDLRDEAGVPEGTACYRFVFPSAFYHQVHAAFSELHPQGGEGAKGGDPDVLFFCNGGFVYLDEDGAVLGALALTNEPSRFFFQYHHPEQLDAKDAQRLTSLSRWRPITKGELRTRGAKYFTFVYPRETLATRQFPDHGTFAYLFREPHEPADGRDRYFTPVLRY